MTTNNHPAHGLVSLDRLHQIREILSKAAAQSDGGNLGYAMADAVKVIDGEISAFDAEPMAWRWFHLNQWHVTNDEERARDLAWDGVKVIPLYTAPPAQIVPENYVTAEHRRVIEMLLNVCGAAFELADDSCQQEVDGEECHVVPDDAFQKLSDALDEIENTLPTEDVDRPDVFLAWSAMPRAALKSILQAGNSPVIGIDLASEPDRSVEVRYLAPPGYVIVPRVATEKMLIAGLEEANPLGALIDWDASRGDCNTRKQVQEIFKAMLAAAPQPQNEPQNIPEIIPQWIPVSERMPDKLIPVMVMYEDGEMWSAMWNGNRWDDGTEYPDPHAVTHWREMPAAPQQEVKTALEHGMQRYAGAMQKLSEGDK